MKRFLCVTTSGIEDSNRGPKKRKSTVLKRWYYIYSTNPFCRYLSEITNLNDGLTPIGHVNNV